MLAKLLTVDQVAELAQISACTVRRDIRAGRLAVVRVRCRLRIRPEDLARWLRPTPAPARRETQQ